MTTKKIAPKSKKAPAKPAKEPAPSDGSKEPELTSEQVQRLKGGDGIDFSRRRFDQVELYESTYRDCDFTDTVMANMAARMSSFTRCAFVRTDVGYELFSRCSFTACDFTSILANGAVFVNCSFESMSLSEEFLESAVFQSCRFEHCGFPDGVPIHMQRLPTGQFTAYKSVRGPRLGCYVLELLVPRSAERVIGLDALDSRSSNYGKCRVSKAKVVRVFNQNLKDVTGLPSTPKVFRSRHHYSFTYKVGEWVKPDSFDSNPGTICSNGIHIFLYPEQAAAY